MFEQILETGSSRPLKGRSLGGGCKYIYIYMHVYIHMHIRYMASHLSMDRSIYLSTAIRPLKPHSKLQWKRARKRLVVVAHGMDLG